MVDVCAAALRARGPTFAPMLQLRPRAATTFEIHGAALRQLLRDLQLGFRALAGGQDLHFGLGADVATLGPGLAVRTEGGMLPGNLGGYAELEIAPVAKPGGKPTGPATRQTVRLSQGKSDSFVSVHLDYLQAEAPDEAAATAAAALGSVIERWAGRYKFKSSRGALLNHVIRTDSAQRCAELSDYIIDDRREYCIVVVTEQFRTGAPACNPGALSAELAGFATVCALSQDYTRRLGENLGGRDYAVFDGAVRVYAPDYRAGDSYQTNPLLLGADVARMADDGTLPAHLFDCVQAHLSSRSFAPPEDFKRIRRLLTTAEYRGEAKGAEALNLLEAELAYADALGIIAELRERVRFLEGELSRSTDGPHADAEPSAAVPLDEVLLEALIDIPEVRVWSSAIESASKVGAQGYVESTVRKALAGITELARTLSATEDFQLGQQPYYWFRNRNLTYKASESQTTMALHGQTRHWTEGATTREVQSHLTLNPNTDRCVQVYFDADPGARCVHVVYLGAHLPTASQTHNN